MLEYHQLSEAIYPKNDKKVNIISPTWNHDSLYAIYDYNAILNLTFMLK